MKISNEVLFVQIRYNEGAADSHHSLFVIIPNGKDPIVAQLTAMPNVIAATGPFNSTKLLAENSLEKKTSGTLVGMSPVSGILLFYVALPKNIVQASETRWEVSVKDVYEKETSIAQLVGDWLHR